MPTSRPVRQHRRRLVVAALACGAAVIGGCGGSSESPQAKAFLADANSKCTALLSKVSQAANSTKTNAPRDDLLARAQIALVHASQDVSALNAPSDKRTAQQDLAARLKTGADAIGQYLRDQQVNESATSSDYNTIVEQLSDLQQHASQYGIKACAIPVE